MNAPLGTYIGDHLAGAAFALNLLRRIERNTDDLHLREFAARLHREISFDRRQLEKIAADLGFRPGGVKTALARLGEKLSRIKLRRFGSNAMGLFEALETLALGIIGKLALWSALEALGDPRLRDFDFPAFKQRAVQQHAEVENRRLHAARRALAHAGT